MIVKDPLDASPVSEEQAMYNDPLTNAMHSDEKAEFTRKGLDLTSRIVGTSIATAFASASIYRTIAPLSKIHTVSVEYSKIHVKNIFSNVTLIMLNLMRYYFLNYMPIQPSVVMAGIPMPSIQEISHAMSDKLLKYRATGGIFLAHQPGGEQTLRLVGKAFGRNRFLFLSMLDFLFIYGSAKVVDLFAKAPTVAPWGTPGLGKKAQLEGVLQPQVDPWKEILGSNMDDGREEQHLTFPVITTSATHTNMYIETYEFTESIENGMNCVTYTIFLRKYVPTYPYKYQFTIDENNRVLWYYSEDKDDKLISRLRSVDLAMEAGFSTAMVMYRFFQYLAGNSIETSIGYVTGINLNQQNLGIDPTGEILAEIYTDIDYNLNTLSTGQKEELMQVG